MDPTRRMGRHRSPGVASEWPAAPLLPPAVDELLSSYLVRASHRMGTSPHRLATAWELGSAFWTRDIDVAADAELLARIEHESGLKAEQLRALTLYDLFGFERPGTFAWNQCYKWVNSVGVHGRTRSRFGLQYCPLCLRDAAVFIRRWRLAPVFACPAHGLLLQDCCPVCQRPIALHRAKRDLLRCSWCAAHLANTAVKYREADTHILALQNWFMQCVGHEQQLVLGTPVARSEYIRGASAITRIIKQLLSTHSLFADLLQKSDTRFEALRLQRQACRQLVFNLLREVLDDWPSNFLQLGSVAHLSRRSFAPCGTLPVWLAQAVEALPPRLRGHAGPESFVRYIRCLEAQHGTGVRALRSEALMRAAKGSYEH